MDRHTRKLEQKKNRRKANEIKSFSWNNWSKSSGLSRTVCDVICYVGVCKAGTLV